MNFLLRIFKKISHPSENLSQKAVRGGFWVFALRIIEQIFGFLRLVILARILAPQDFGLMGIALLTMSILDTFSETGFHTALIQKKGNIRVYLDAAWTVGILRGSLLFGILYLSAPLIAVFFGSPLAVPIIRVIGFSLLFEGFRNVAVVCFQKELEFNKQFIYQISGTLADFIAAVSAALILKNVWALIFGLLAGNLTRAILSYFIHPYRPRLSFELEKIKELFEFGRWVLGSSILGFLITQGDDIFVGKLLGVVALGFYQLAYRISNMPATEITHIISQITFPAYSKLQDNLPKLKEAFLKVLQVTTFLSFPVAGLIFIVSPELTRVFLGEKWMPMVPAMQVLCIFGVLRSVGASIGTIWYGTGNPQIQAKLAMLQLAFQVIIIYPLTVRFKLLGVSFAVTLANMLVVSAGIFRLNRLVKLDPSEFSAFWKTILYPLISTFLFCLVIGWQKNVFKNPHNIIPLLSMILTGLTIYSISMYFWNRYTTYKIKNLLVSLVE